MQNDYYTRDVKKQIHREIVDIPGPVAVFPFSVINAFSLVNHPA